MNEEDAKKYPQHAKVEGIRDQSQVIHDFLEWLTGTKKMVIAEYNDDGSTWSSGWVPTRMKHDDILYAYFDIDGKAFADEKDAMLDEIRAMIKEGE